MFSRENQTNKNLNLSDNKLLDMQKDIKSKNNENTAKHISKNPPKNEIFNVGDIISIKSEKNKNNVRDGYMVTATKKETLQINKLIRFHGENTKVQNKPRIIQSKDAFKIMPNSMHYVDNTTSKPLLVQNPIGPLKQLSLAKNNWQPFGNFNISFDEEISSNKISNETLIPNDSNIDYETDDEFFDTNNTTDQEIQSDPYKSFREWEQNQRSHAKDALNHYQSSPITTTRALVNDITTENLPRNRLVSSTSYHWDHEFDINHSQLSSSTESDIFNLPLPHPFLQVQRIDDLARQTASNINTNQCQLLEGLLPPPSPIMPLETNTYDESDNSSPPAARTRSRTR